MRPERRRGYGPRAASYDWAHARVQAIKGFYIHASAYVLVNLALFAINVLVGGMVVLLAAPWLGHRPRVARPGGVRLQRRRTLGPRVGGAQDQGAHGPRPGTLAFIHSSAGETNSQKSMCRSVHRAPVLRRIRPLLTLRAQKADHYMPRARTRMRTDESATLRRDTDTGGGGSRRHGPGSITRGKPCLTWMRI